MFALQFLSPAILRVAVSVSRYVGKFLMFAGLVFMLALAGSYHGHSGLLDGLRSMFPATVDASENETVDPVDPVVPAQTVEAVARLSQPMQGALQFVARRYRVSHEALQPIFAAAEGSARELGLDPLLIIAVIGVESGFNPFSQSVVGAQGLMQVMPRFHADKLPEDAGALPFFDPLTNVQVGARVLKESISRNGGLVPGLQQFGGALADPEQRYSAKVLAERARLAQAAQRLRKA